MKNRKDKLNLPHGEYKTWGELIDAVDACFRCEDIALESKVFGDGDAKADIALVGEGPGHYEVLHGTVFIGRAGELLNQAIQDAGLKRPAVYIANVLRCRAFERDGRRRKDRAPLPQEVENCTPFLHATLDLVKPRVIVAMGLPAVQATARKAINRFDVFDEEYTEKVRTSKGLGPAMTGVKKGYTFWYKSGVQVLPTWHPSYANRQRSTALFEQIRDTIGKAKTIAKQLRRSSG